MGKSALLKKLEINLQEEQFGDDIIISVTGNELIGMGDFSGNNQAYLENHWKQVICKRLCVEIGKKIKFAVSDNSITLVESSEIEGFKGRNITSALADRMTGFFQSFAGLQPSEVKKIGIVNPFESLKRFQDKENRNVWLLIDDVDAKYIDNEENQQRIGSFFSAIRSLAFAVQGLKIRASVRTDVWRNLRLMEDQDKIRQYVIDINWKDAALKSIFSKRILTYLNKIDLPPARSWDSERNYREIVDMVFDGPWRWDEQMLDPFIAIKILAGSRPRWMGQLCKLAGHHSDNKRMKLADVRKAMQDFGMEKVSDILKEHAHQFSDLSKIIDAFRSGAREYNNHKLTQLMQRGYVDKVQGVVPNINGYPFFNVNQICEFLYQIDFLTARIKDKKEFIPFQNDPDLFKSDQNSKNLIMWTINASYRNFLRIE